MKPVLLVGLGGDIGTYAFQRAAHERFGWECAVVSPRITTFGKYSTLAKWIIEPEIFTPDVLIARLDAIAAEHPDHDLMLFTNLDWHVRVLAERRAQLDPRWNLPFPDLATFDRVSSKVAFAQACAQVDIRTPLTIAVTFGAPEEPAAPSSTATPSTTTPDHQADAPVTSPTPVAQALDRLRDAGVAYPVIGKPSASADWFGVSFPGKQKIHHFENEAQVREVLDHLARLDYPSEFLLQEFVPGDETHMRSLTAYRDSSGVVTLLAGGQVLLEEHTPGTLGIPAAILTQVDQEALDAAARFLDHTHYFGFANFDYKVHARTGERVFFEVNPRIGRNNYYVTAAGVNVAEVAARDLLPDHVAHLPALPVPATPTREVLYSVTPFRMLLRYLLDPALRSRVVAAKRAEGIAHPLKYQAGDPSLRRRAYVRALDWRLSRKFREHYPRPTESGF